MLVKWTVDRPLDRQFLPRLPAAICHLSLAPDNRYLAISTSDNGEFECVTCILTELVYGHALHNNISVDYKRHIQWW